MRSSLVRVIVASSLLVGCGGGTPPPKDENEAVEHSSAKADTDTKPSTESPAAAPSAPASEPAAPPPSTKSSSGDLVAPAADDPWMAPHQMPATDVIKTMRGAKGRVNVCWQQARKRDPSVSGEVKIKFVISHEGSVAVWRNEDSTASDGEAINCVGEVIKALKFPTQKAPGTAWGIYQINFGG